MNIKLRRKLERTLNHFVIALLALSAVMFMSGAEAQEKPVTAMACVMSADRLLTCSLEDDTKMVIRLEQASALPENLWSNTSELGKEAWKATAAWTNANWHNTKNKAVSVTVNGYNWTRSFMGYEDNFWYSTLLIGGSTAALSGAAVTGATGFLGVVGIVTAPAWAPFAITAGTVAVVGGSVMLAVDNYDSYRWEDFRDKLEDAVESVKED